MNWTERVNWTSPKGRALFTLLSPVFALYLLAYGCYVVGLVAALELRAQFKLLAISFDLRWLSSQD